MDLWSEFHGPNAAYVLELYDRYLTDPGQVDTATRAFFDRWTPQEIKAAITAGERPASPGEPTPPADFSSLAQQKIAAVTNLAQSIRFYGHWASRLDPLGSLPPGDPALHLETYGLSEDDLRALPASLVGGPSTAQFASAMEAIQHLREIYTSSVGHDYLQIRNPEERQWLRDAAETRRFCVVHAPVDPLWLLDRLTQVEVFEHFLQRAFPGKTRFSIEGLDTLLPLLDTLVGGAAEAGIHNILIGMAHRGRLNVLAHLLNKPYDQILAEFKDPLRTRPLQYESASWAGDVKYHAGARRTLDNNDPSTIDLTIQLAPNPSHLEAVNPVVAGMARAAGTRTDRPGPPEFNPAITLPVVIHGDAAFPGQGVVAETLNLYRLEGYTTGGTIHIIANNQLGFTTNPSDSRSTLFASDIAKGYRIPILHVNADDPEAIIMAARLALAYRARFQRDFLIDLIGYRRLGHNEGDEPAFTQPLIYNKVAKHPTVRQIWAERLVQRGVLPPGRAEQLYQEKLAALQAELDRLDAEGSLAEPIPPSPPPGAARRTRTGVSRERLQRLSRELLRLPVGFTPHPRLARIRQRRENTLLEEGEGWPTVDWSAAEELAFATILEDGIPIRLTGQDVERGTFSHRHAALSDVNTGEVYVPLQSLPQATASFEIHNSPLSEYAALGFEFGYNVQSPNQLVVWEAQYGDFINNAQAIVDEFIVSARDKWGQLPGLVMLLPHGYEGQGPDHSSGRLERFLNLFADNNLRVANPTTAANYFHLLRRQAALLEIDPLPLVVMTPKSLLRHPLMTSSLQTLVEGGWQAIIPPQGEAAAKQVRRLILCSGKVYADLWTSELREKHPEVAVARVEQLAPFPDQPIRDLLAQYSGLEEVCWVQEEPENMGAWQYIRPHLEQVVAGRWPLRRVTRARSASPAEGSSSLHAFIQRRLIERAFTAHQEPGPAAQPEPSTMTRRSSAPDALQGGNHGTSN